MRIKPDAASILAGLVFIAIGLVYLLSSGGHVTVGARWAFSLLVLGLGLTAVVGLLTRRRR
ncbi:hypothetical protein [Actinospica robiniae]|jgi:hypothetical protein|uniref:hypothetical protein n=1 Tax=Actinospica robiniae TaxID=304901 RepID=UPI0004004AE3|nr:hypothetical protein [Actinospica robiniae]